MGNVKIDKPISRKYAMKSFRDFEDYALYEEVKEEIVDQEENYERVDADEPNALLVVDDSMVTPSEHEIGLSLVLEFIPDIEISEYVKYIPKISHMEDVKEEKYARRIKDDMTDEEIEDMFDITGEELEIYKSLIRDKIISSSSLWSSKKVNDELNSLEDRIDIKLGSIGAMSIKIVTELPEYPKENIFYVLDEGADSMPIWIYSEGKWVKTGADLSHIDFENYVKKSEVSSDYTTARDTDVITFKLLKEYVTDTPNDEIKKLFE